MSARHCRSDGGQQGATIAGEILDLQAAVDAAGEGFGVPLSVVASRFGAVSTCLSPPYLEGSLRSLVLWNPVLDLHRNVGGAELALGGRELRPGTAGVVVFAGVVSVEGTFEMGRVMFEEMRHYSPIDDFVKSPGSRGPR